MPINFIVFRKLKFHYLPMSPRPQSLQKLFIELLLIIKGHELQRLVYEA